MSFHLSVSGEEPPLTTQQKLAIYRVLQELLTNALKHSKATRVEVFLRFKARSLVLEVKDNGCGYDPRNPMGSGIGLRNIEARLKLLKASYHNRSEPGRGADFFIEVPLRRRTPTKARPS
jgi:signal transduction histidine kinase